MYFFPLNKWQVLLREFILHLETLMGKNTIAAETETFVLENLRNIQEAVLLKNAVVKSLQEEGLRFLTEHFLIVVMRSQRHLIIGKVIRHCASDCRTG